MCKHLFNKFNASQQIHAEINEIPVDALTRVLFLLQHEHNVIEELLQFLVGEVDAQLLETVVLRIAIFVFIYVFLCKL